MNLRTSLRLALWLSAIPLVALAAAQVRRRAIPTSRSRA